MRTLIKTLLTASMALFLLTGAASTSVACDNPPCGGSRS